MLGDIKKHKLFFAVAIFVLFCSFAFNVFGAVSTDRFILSYKDSEALVSNQIKCEGELFNNQLLKREEHHGSGPLTPCGESQFVPYTSQFGLQGKVYTLGFNVLSSFTNIRLDVYIAIAQLLTALATAVVFSLVAVWVRSRFGLVPASIFTFLLAISPMIVGFSRNLYWAVPLFILPLVFTLYYYRHKATKRKAVIFWSILGLLLYLRYLCGYEYITTITIMITAVVAYHLYSNKAKLKDYIRQIIVVGIVSVVAFTLALATHINALNAQTGSTSKSIDIIKHRAEERTSNAADRYLASSYANLEGLANSHYRITGTYINYDEHREANSKKWATLVAFSNYMLLPVIHLPISLASSFSLYIQSMGMFILLLLALYLTRKRWVRKKMLHQVNGLFLASVIGLIGYFSWLTLAYSHSLVHAHINGILMYLPFALFGYIIIGLFIESFAERFLKMRKR